jgi:hypothetical protein
MRNLCLLQLVRCNEKGYDVAKLQQKMSNTTRLQLNRQVAMDMTFS